MGPTDLPHFAITAIRASCCTGQFAPSPWVGEGWIAALYVGAGRFVWGRFRQVDAASGNCSFYPDRIAELAELRPGGSYPYMDGYWGERAELILDEDRRWQRTKFEPRDAVRFPTAGGWMTTRASPELHSGGELVPGGWDHEHCDICQKKIGVGGEPEGYFSPPHGWVCEECYTSFVAPRSLAFVPDNRRGEGGRESLS